MSQHWRLRLRGFGVWALRAVGGLLRLFAAGVRLLWVRLSPRARLAVSIATLLVIAANTQSFAPTVSATAQGLAVLVVALLGLRMILAGPVRGRG